MPATVRKRFPKEDGKAWKIVEDGEVVASSDTEKKANRAAEYRNEAYKKKHGR